MNTLRVVLSALFLTVAFVMVFAAPKVGVLMIVAAWAVLRTEAS